MNDLESTIRSEIEVVDNYYYNEEAVNDFFEDLNDGLYDVE